MKPGVGSRSGEARSGDSNPYCTALLKLFPVAKLTIVVTETGAFRNGFSKAFSRTGRRLVPLVWKRDRCWEKQVLGLDFIRG